MDYRFPILIWNLISELGNSDLLPTTGITCGSSIRINAPLNGLVPSLVFPDGKTEKLNELPLLFRNTDAPGAYFLNKDNDRSEAFAVNFDTTESRYVNATVTAETTDKNTVVVDATTTVAKNYRPLIIILLLLILAFEWIVYIKD